MDEFDKWWVTYSDKCRHPCDDVEYYAAKEAWFASRESIEIDVGDEPENESPYYYAGRDEVINNILAAGLKVKAP